MNWIIFWLAIYLVLIIYFTLKHVKVGNLENYLVNDRKTKTFPLVATTLATFVGGGTSMGLMAMGYKSGFAAVGIGVAYVIGFFILSRFAGSINSEGRKNKIYSFSQYLNNKFVGNDTDGYSKTLSSLMNGINIFIFFFLLAAQFVAMASLLKIAFEIGYLPSVIISSIIVIIYTAFAGMAGVIITDLVQFIIIVLMIVFIFVPGIWVDTEHFTRLAELPKEMLNGTSEGIAFLIAVPIFLSVSVLVRLDIWQRILAAKDAKTAKKVSIISGLGMLPFYIIFPLIGMTIKVVLDAPLENSADVASEFLKRHSAAPIFGFAVVGLLAALMSSGDSFLNVISISAIKDFAGRKKVKTEIDPKQLHKSIRTISIFFGLAALVMALVLPDIVDLMVVGLTSIAIFAPVTILALTKKDVKVYKKEALYSLFAGFIVNVAFFTWGTISPEQFNNKSSFIPAFIIAVLVLVFGVMIKKNKLKNNM